MAVHLLLLNQPLITAMVDMTDPPSPRSRPCLFWTGGTLLTLILLALGGAALEGPLVERRLNRSVAALQALAVPGTATKTDPPGLTRHTFKNGEWVVFLANDSHWSLSGGSVALRDSRGQTRAFMGGHICGSQAMRRACIRLELGSGGAPVGLNELIADLQSDMQEIQVE